MKVYKSENGIIASEKGKYYLLHGQVWDELINTKNLHQKISSEINHETFVGDESWFGEQKILAPIGSQEVWAAGVTYLRSKTARMEESKDSGGATFYDKVYDAERPELFFKATQHRVSGHKELLNIRKDSTWNVPEPELVLFINSSGEIAGYSIGNDMSSRSIEGENPLYLPQAKVYDRCAGLGPCIFVDDKPISADAKISITIIRKKQNVFEGSTSINQMKRKHAELVEFLFRESSFPNGVFLMTGTCIVPENDFTLQSGDEMKITIDSIGTLVNYVA